MCKGTQEQMVFTLLVVCLTAGGIVQGHRLSPTGSVGGARKGVLVELGGGERKATQNGHNGYVILHGHGIETKSNELTAV